MGKTAGKLRALVAAALLGAFAVMAAGSGSSGQAAPQAGRRFSPPDRSKDDMSGHEVQTIVHQGIRRNYFVHLPKNYDPSRKYAAVLGFHGGGGRAWGQKTHSQMNTVADRYGFLAVYPEGSGPNRLLTWNAGTCCAYAVQHKIDDVGYVSKVIDDLARRYPVDTQRVYATGLSNGAMLCYRLACELSDKIAAIGPVAGDLGVEGPQPKRAVPVIHFHGMKDPNAPYEGGVGPNTFTNVVHRSVPETISWWVKADNCQPDPVEVKNERDYIIKRWAPASGTTGAPVVLYSLPEGGHNWPGGVDTTARIGTGNHIKTVDASTIMWKFFEKFTLAGPVAAGGK